MNKDRKGWSLLRISKEERKKFLKYNYAEDKSNFSRGVLVVVLVLFLFIPTRFLKANGFDTNLGYHILTLFVYFLAYLIIRNHRGSVRSFQWLSFMAILGATILDHINSYYELSYAFSLPNALIANFFFLYLLSGLYFNYSLVLHAIILLIYLVYAWTVGRSQPFYIEEAPDLVGISILIAYAGYLVQTYKYNKYQQSLVIERQYDNIKKEHDEYQKLNTVKDRLLSILSHDVRSPLDSLQGFIYLLENKLLNEEEVNELLSELKVKLSRTTEFVGHTLLWSKNQIGGFSPKPQTMNVKDLLQKTVELYEHHITEKQLNVNIRCADDLNIMADEEMAYIVARNLLNNAIKFTSNGKSIVLSAVEKHDQVDVSIVDEGVGISEEQITHIFNVIQQPSLGTRGEKGTGLGLSLSKELMEKIGGDLSIESNQPKNGTTCRMTFPKA